MVRPFCIQPWLGQSQKIFITKQSTLEECRKRKLNQKPEFFLQLNPDYPDSHPEYPDIPTRTIRTYVRSLRKHSWCLSSSPPSKCKNLFKSMNDMMHNA